MNDTQKLQNSAAIKASAPESGSAYPWADVKAGRYICLWPDNDRKPLPVEIINGAGDYKGNLMYRWSKATIPGRLMYEMPKCCFLVPNTKNEGLTAPRENHEN